MKETSKCTVCQKLAFKVVETYPTGFTIKALNYCEDHLYHLDKYTYKLLFSDKEED